jgi:hypothetical protein
MADRASTFVPALDADPGRLIECHASDACIPLRQAH